MATEDQLRDALQRSMRSVDPPVPELVARALRDGRASRRSRVLAWGAGVAAAAAVLLAVAVVTRGSHPSEWPGRRGRTLHAPPAKQVNNKVLWVARTVGAGPLSVEAVRAEDGRSAHREVGGRSGTLDDRPAWSRMLAPDAELGRRPGPQRHDGPGVRGPAGPCPLTPRPGQRPVQRPARISCTAWTA